MQVDLPDVTLICVSGVDYEGSLYALWRSTRNIRFAKAVLVSPVKPANLPGGVVHETSVGTNLDSIDAYSHYMIYDLWRHVDTSHCLVVQADGYVLSPELWRNEWLAFDYIGAPWRKTPEAYIDPFGNSQRVGNGGFSLRSKKLLEVPRKVDVPWEVNLGDFYKHMDAGLYSEDGNICVHNRHIFEQQGCVWAPLDEALVFSKEQRVSEYRGEQTFGFHKKLPNFRHHVRDYLARREFRKNRT